MKIEIRIEHRHRRRLEEEYELDPYQVGLGKVTEHPGAESPELERQLGPARLTVQAPALVLGFTV